MSVRLERVYAWVPEKEYVRSWKSSTYAGAYEGYANREPFALDGDEDAITSSIWLKNCTLASVKLKNGGGEKTGPAQRANALYSEKRADSTIT